MFSENNIFNLRHSVIDGEQRASGGGDGGHAPNTGHAEAGLQIAHGDMALVSATGEDVGEPVPV